MNRAIACLISLTPAVAQAGWTPVAATTAPTDRFLHGFADGPGGALVLFGGARTASTLFGDTWLLDGNGWRQATPAQAPSARSGHGMVFDLVRDRVVLFGGSTGNLLADTWEWDGGSWQQRLPPHTPPGRLQFGMAYDLRRQVSVVFSGYGVGADTWEWNGNDWAQVVTPNAPAERTAQHMAWSPENGRIVLFGGYSQSNGMLADTWEYDGANWSQRSPAHSPPPRCCNVMAADWLRGRVVVFGGANGTLDRNDTWEWDGNDWLQRNPTSSPSPRRGTVLVYDLTRSRSVMFGGGVGGNGTPTLADTWQYATTTPATVRALAPGCPGTAGTAALRMLGNPWLGDTTTLVVDPTPAAAFTLLVFGWSPTAWGSLSLPLSLAPYGAPGCALAVSADAIAAMSASTQPTLAVAIPASPALAGLQFHAQALIADAAANTAGFVLSSALQARIGVR